MTPKIKAILFLTSAFLILSALFSMPARAVVLVPNSNCPIATSGQYGCVKLGSQFSTDANGALNVTVSGAGSVALSGVAAASTTASINSGSNAIVWAWNSATTQNPFTLSSSSLTTGHLFSLSNTSTAHSGRVLSAASATTSSGYAVYGSLTGAGNTGYAGFFSNSATTGYGVYVDGRATVTNTFVLSNLTTGGLRANGSGVVTSVAGGLILFPTSTYPLEASTTGQQGNIYPNIHTGAGGNASASEFGWALANTMTAANGDPALLMRYKMPPVLPAGGTRKLVSDCFGATGSGNLKYTVSNAMVPAGSDPSAASLTGESQNTLTMTTTGGYHETKTTLTPAAVAGATAVVTVTFNRTDTTIGAPVNCRWSMIWE